MGLQTANLGGSCSRKIHPCVRPLTERAITLACLFGEQPARRRDCEFAVPVHQPLLLRITLPAVYPAPNEQRCPRLPGSRSALNLWNAMMEPAELVLP